MEKPVVKLIGGDGNIFSILGKCTKELKKNGLVSEAKELAEKVFQAKSYDEAIQICMEYVEIE